MFLRYWLASLSMFVVFGAGAQSMVDPAQASTQGVSTGLTQGQRGVTTGAGTDTPPSIPGVPSITGTNDLASQLLRNQTANATSADATKLKPPLPPAEFQRFVQATTGQLLPLFGQNLFADVVSSYAPVDQVPVPADYVLGPGDELRIRAWGSVDADLSAPVDRNGMINIPRVGSFGVAGIKAGEAEAYLRNQISRIFKNFELNVTLGQLRSVRIFVVGQAVRPGSYTVSSLSTLVTALFASGGPNENGSMRHIVLRRGDKVVTDFDLYDFLVNGNKLKDARLLPGDVILIPPAGPRVAILGAVKAPAIYELSSATESMAKVLSYGGGTGVTTATGKAQLERVDPVNANAGAPRQVSVVTLDPTNLSQSLRDGDILTAFEVKPIFSNAVTLRGNVEQPLRYPFQPGMRISTLIPERSALVTRDYYKRQNQLVQYLDPATLSGIANSLSPSGADDSRGLTVTNPNPNPSAMLDGSGALSSLGSAANAASIGAGGLSQNASTRNVRESNEAANANATTDGWNDPRGRNDRLPDPNALLDQVNWDYAAVERLDPKTLAVQLIPFNLRKAIVEKDPANDIELQPGDVVTIFSLRDVRGPGTRQTRFVRIEGEVQSPGIYQLLPAETLRQALRRIGGLTDQAYTFGLRFTRESARVQQNQVLKDALRRLESSLASSSLEQVANASASDAQSATAQLAAQRMAQQTQLARLRSIKPIGRISLELPLDVKGVDELPDLPLENGDSVLVPSRPGFVYAVGAVANENALIWRNGRTVSDYLRAAGLDVAADEDAIFVVRADGSVVHARDYDGIFSNKLGEVALMPGDSIVVPEKLDRSSKWTAFIRGFKDWTQILYQFALGAAAFHTLQN